MFAAATQTQIKAPAGKPRKEEPARSGEVSSTTNPIWQSFALNMAAVQPKLSVSQPDDPYEQEADRVADRVMRMPASLSAAVEFPNWQSDNLRLSHTPVCSRKVQRKCDDCAEEEKLQRKAEGSNADSSANAPSTVYEALNSPGQPLDPTTRAFFELRFGHDFGGVRLHTGSEAEASARAMRARAYTTGDQVVFGTGEYAPETTGGQRLLAHELTHVVQQSEGSTRVQRQQPAGTGQQQPPQQQLAPNLMKIYSFGPSGAGRYAHDAGTTIFRPPAPVDAAGNELVQAGTRAQPILSRFGRWFSLDERERPLTPPVPDSSIKLGKSWRADDGSESWHNWEHVTGTYYGPGQPLGSSLGSEYIFRNDRPGVLDLAYILVNARVRYFLILVHTVHYVNDPAAPPGATVLPDHPGAPAPPGANTS